MYTEEERAKFRERIKAWKAGEKVYEAGRPIVEKTDATTVQRQEPVQPIKREYGRVVDPKLVERKQQQQPVVKAGNTYKTAPRPQTFAGRVAQVAGKDWIKTDAASASAGMALAQVPVIGPVLSAAWGAPDFGYDLNESIHNITDQEAHGNTAMSGLALLPFTRSGLKMLKGKTYVDRLRNVYDSWMTKYNTSREVNRALKTARISDAVQDGTNGIVNDLWDKHYFRALNESDVKGAANLREAHFRISAPNTKITKKLYHGTDSSWNTYDPQKFGSATDDGYYGRGLYATESENMSKTYGTPKKLYINMQSPYMAGSFDINGNPFPIDIATQRTGPASLFNKTFELFDQHPGRTPGVIYVPKRMYSPDLIEELKKSDGVIYGVGNQRYNEVVIPNGIQMKSANIMSFDDSGNIIPLSKRDNFLIDDIRY